METAPINPPAKKSGTTTFLEKNNEVRFPKIKIPIMLAKNGKGDVWKNMEVINVQGFVEKSSVSVGIKTFSVMRSANSASKYPMACKVM